MMIFTKTSVIIMSKVNSMWQEEWYAKENEWA